MLVFLTDSGMALRHELTWTLVLLLVTVNRRTRISRKFCSAGKKMNTPQIISELRVQASSRLKCSSCSGVVSPSESSHFLLFILIRNARWASILYYGLTILLSFGFALPMEHVKTLSSQQELLDAQASPNRHPSPTLRSMLSPHIPRGYAALP